MGVLGNKKDKYLNMGGRACAGQATPLIKNTEGEINTISNKACALFLNNNPMVIPRNAIVNR
jgi:hypothetical protein